MFDVVNQNLLAKPVYDMKKGECTQLHTINLPPPPPGPPPLKEGLLLLRLAAPNQESGNNIQWPSEYRTPEYQTPEYRIHLNTRLFSLQYSNGTT